MRYVIIRDDDTNAITPIECLEKLYRPFLDRGLTVNLATIPNVSTTATRPDGKPELFLLAKKGGAARHLPMCTNPKLVNYLKTSGYQIVQHGFTHEFVDGQMEFNRDDRADIAQRLDQGTELLLDAGFAQPATFVAPYDQLSRVSLEEVAARFRILSTGWYEIGKLPISWLPHYAVKKIAKRPHWQVGNTALLSHPGCHLSFMRPYDLMLDTIKQSIESRRVTVLVTHWWEYFRDNTPDEPFINVLHETAAYLSNRRDIEVISFHDLSSRNISLN
jgi:hypothetical protein